MTLFWRLSLGRASEGGRPTMKLAGHQSCTSCNFTPATLFVVVDLWLGYNDPTRLSLGLSFVD